jgi:hypothetical protein
MLSCAKGDARWQRVKPRLRSWRQIMVCDIANPDDALGLASMKSSRSRAANKSGGAVAIAIVRFVSQALLLRQAGRDPHRLADRPRGATISLSSSANRASLESLKALMQSGAVCTPPASGGTEPGELPSPYAAHRPLESSRRAAPRPQSSHHFHHVGRDRWDAASSSQRPDRRHLPR